MATITAAATLTAGAIPRIERRTLPAQIAAKLRELILLETLAPGAVIPERETAEALGVSRTPLREALRILAAEGLVDMAPSRRPLVANPTVEEIGQLLKVLGAIEGLAGELACEIATDAELDRLAALHREMVAVSERSEPLAFFDLDMRFHRLIVEAARNVPLAETHSQYNARLFRARFISSRRRINRDGTLAQHGTIVDALRSRDVAAAATALRHHLDATQVNVAAVTGTLQRQPGVS